MADRRDELMSAGGQCCIVFMPRINEYQGWRSIELEVRDFQPGARPWKGRTSSHLPSGLKGRFCQPRPTGLGKTPKHPVALKGRFTGRDNERPFQGRNSNARLSQACRPGLTEPALQAGRPLALMKLVLRPRKRPALDFTAIRLHRLDQCLAQVGVLLGEAGVEFVQAEHVVRDKDLAVAAGPGADADGRDLDGPR